jgi:two-component system, OmpR family, sensor histidine kinase KdpD
MALIKIDFRLFEYALSNIILNATQYAGKNVSILIECSVVKNKLYINISDDGKGIPSDDANFIFDKFYRVKNSPAGGTGLGLSIVKSIIELHKGRIHFEQNSPQGSKFIIELPYEIPPTAPEEQEI